MTLIQAMNVTFSYEGSYDNIFEQTSFQLDTDWRLGLTGRNGRGKTTLLKLLAGELEYSGRISAQVEFDYFPFEVADPWELTGEVVAAIVPEHERWELVRELSLLEMQEEALYRPFGSLSNGEQTKVLLAALFLKENRFLLIDEPTNHLDMKARELVGRYLKGKKGFILVSHDRAFLDQCVDHLMIIHKTGIEVRKGGFTEWWEDKERQDASELAENERLRKEISRLSEASRRTEGWSDKVEKTKNGSRNSGIKPDKGYVSHKAAKMMKRSKTLERRQQDAIDDKTKLLKNIESAEDLKLSQLRYHKSRLLELENVTLFYGEKAVCRHPGFTVEQGDRIALVGRNGSGKSSLLKLICGEDVTYTGLFRRGSQLRVSYVPQDATWLKGDLSGYAAACGIDESLFKAILRKLDFARIQFTKDMSAYSAGQKKKVLIARSLCEQAHLHIWDEPLNYIDVLSRMQIEELLLDYEPTILFVEHDRQFADHIATKLVEL